ncbi:MAG TPA: hypothetical protein P5061_01240, partial [Mycobacterium sp.]|nr:hypothetical protein [Mycobacterium sp.]
PAPAGTAEKEAWDAARADARARGLTPAAEEVPTKQAPAPANKARKPATKRAEAAAAAFRKGTD